MFFSIHRQLFFQLFAEKSTKYGIILHLSLVPQELRDRIGHSQNVYSHDRENHRNYAFRQGIASIS